VLFDRHFFSDYYAYEIANNHSERPLANRIHGLMLKHLYPKPDLVICLDAPAEVLFARKGEGTLEFLEHRRQEYLQLQAVVPHFATVDATQPEEEVTRKVAALIGDFYRTKSNKVIKVGSNK
jgi:thymidylate kinase